MPSNNFSKHYIIGGSIGVLVCILLFVFYLFAYFPLMEKLNDKGQNGDASILPAFLTGHAFPLLTHFIIEGSPAIGIFCPNVEKVCTSWSAGTSPDYPEWIMENTTGYCTDLIMVPTTACSDKVEFTGFIVLTAVLIAAYFFLGIIITWLILRKKTSHS